MPEEGIDFSDRKDLMSFEEIIRLSRIFNGLGVDKIRLTGGEPFVRKGFDQLLTSLCGIFSKVHITTNATLLHEHFDLLKSINIGGLNISIDSLDSDKFFLITRRDSYDIVMSNILAAKKHNIPTKINAVIMKGVNDMEIADFVRFGMEHDIQVRFIEAMPFNEHDGNKDVFLPASDILENIKSNFQSVEKASAENGSSSNIYLVDNTYKVGIIPAYTRSLCASCNRIRLTPKGELLNCLYSQKGIELLPLLRDEHYSDEAIIEVIKNSVAHKLKSGTDEESLRVENVFSSMTSIGG